MGEYKNASCSKCGSCCSSQFRDSALCHACFSRGNRMNFNAKDARNMTITAQLSKVREFWTTEAEPKIKQAATCGANSCKISIPKQQIEDVVDFAKDLEFTMTSCDDENQTLIEDYDYIIGW